MRSFGGGFVFVKFVVAFRGAPGSSWRLLAAPAGVSWRLCVAMLAGLGGFWRLFWQLLLAAGAPGGFCWLLAALLAAPGGSLPAPDGSPGSSWRQLLTPGGCCGLRVASGGRFMFYNSGVIFFNVSLHEPRLACRVDSNAPPTALHECEVSLTA